ncbi:hypothetical protein T02_2274 [Trichinella nativa]|uniref:Uncharacterized protein n=1 Tax=Trichinella nativa TaxID=6335 RepID=A0A0V1KTL3_9BILA|nr:hypothetical protein T06_1317 [Trichinella sp. T6]KRZ50284.1 hypothetical protein T02_2274 [Trichinella nativa]
MKRCSMWDHTYILKRILTVLDKTMQQSVENKICKDLCALLDAYLHMAVKIVKAIFINIFYIK